MVFLQIHLYLSLFQHFNVAQIRVSVRVCVCVCVPSNLEIFRCTTSCLHLRFTVRNLWISKCFFSILTQGVSRHRITISPFCPDYLYMFHNNQGLCHPRDLSVLFTLPTSLIDTHFSYMFVISLVVFASHVSNLLYLSFYYCHLLRLCVFSFTCASSTRTYLIYKHY